jgi:DNA recombination protein RmuC
MGLDIAIVALLVLVVILLVYLIATRNKGQATTTLDKRDKDEVIAAFNRNVTMIAGTLQSSVDNLSKEVKTLLANMTEKLSENKVSTERNMLQIQGSINASLEQTRKSLSESLEQIRQTLERNVKEMQQSNQAKLDQIQQTVDEKLTKTLNDRFNESFKVLADQLEKVTKTIGEMQKISSEVGTLSKMLSNVKTTGIFGEIQLGAIIDEILSPEQYEKNVVTNKASRDPVEYVVKLPGGDKGQVWLPIDSKFPYTIYSEMQTAYDQNDFAGFEAKKKQLVQTVKGMAKDIHDKYICPPETTNFAVMFLPVEGLYAEVVKLGLVEDLRSKYNVTVAGPTTMAALLNSLQMGFQTLAIQKKSNEVWTILGAVKTEFGKFGGIIEGIQKKLNGASNDLDTLLGVRTRAIDRSLRNVTASAESSKLLGIAEDVATED